MHLIWCCRCVCALRCMQQCAHSAHWRRACAVRDRYSNWMGLENLWLKTHMFGISRDENIRMHRISRCDDNEIGCALRMESSAAWCHCVDWRCTFSSLNFVFIPMLALHFLRLMLLSIFFLSTPNPYRSSSLFVNIIADAHHSIEQMHNEIRKEHFRTEDEVAKIRRRQQQHSLSLVCGTCRKWNDEIFVLQKQNTKFMRKKEAEAASDGRRISLLCSVNLCAAQFLTSFFALISLDRRLRIGGCVCARVYRIDSNQLIANQSTALFCIFLLLRSRQAQGAQSQLRIENRQQNNWRNDRRTGDR